MNLNENDSACFTHIFVPKIDEIRQKLDQTPIYVTNIRIFEQLADFTPYNWRWFLRYPNETVGAIY